ncbi:hypothetical protein [Novosphingobium cyanobacteriorum]|uniref:J domain-containing protein n=1 Tax=Novosphingobium cyanobacteriorum TaxID=3024215 RepID=A0ABT6CH00_9SPHN|nr:hypothetical protein [Novosphingobium cyanobacteriorum]MDF8332753.1 hypothetical protein [Novosphingobium cyanobacteriorum]
MTPYLSPSAALRLLGLKAGADTPAIRKAYAAKLKALDVDADPEAYARLRAARDIALRSAKAAAAQADAAGDAPATAIEDDAQQPAPEPQETCGAWAYAAPLLPHDPPAQGSAILAGSLPPADAAPEPQAELTAPDAPPGAREATGGPPVLASAAPTDVTLLQRPDRELARLLHSEEDPAPAMDDAEEARALRCLRMMLADAAQADLSLHGQIEDWLADLLAGTWPRSAPLLEETAAAFGWESERGQLGERPSIAWLNTRLRGLRFQQKVELPDHPLHKAWVELQRAGWSKWYQRVGTSRKRINELLAGIRRHFPELEGHLDQQRVSSWEQKPDYSILTFPLRLLGVGLILCAQYYFSWSHNGDRNTQNPLLEPPAYQAPIDPKYNEQLAMAVHAAFGPDKTIQWLREKQISVASAFEARFRSELSNGATPEKATQSTTDFIRRRVFLNGRKDAQLLEQDLQLHLARIDAVSRKGPEACAGYLKSLDIGQVTLSDEVLRKEQALAVRMAETGKLDTPQPSKPTSASVPGKLVGEVMEATGLPQKTVAAAMSHKAGPAEECAVTRALLRATLDWKGPERGAILQTF